jgi:hypothetical protein
VRFHGRILIRRPLDTVFDFVADERNIYDPTIHDAELLTVEPIGVGTRFRCASDRGGRPVEMVVEITDYDRPRRLSTTTHLTSMDISSDLRFEREGEGTLLRWRSVLQPRAALRLLTPALAAFGRRQTVAIWTHLKHALETEPDGTSR